MRDDVSASPTVSVIIPAHDRAETIERAVRSVLEQSLRDLEVVVVDDGSSDATAEIAESTGDPRVRLIRHPVNRGAAAARNTGIRQARGEFIAFLDSDDEFMEGKLAMQLEALQAAMPDVRVSCSALRLEEIDSGRSWDRFHAIAADEFLRMYMGCDLSPGATMLAHRRAFDEVGLLDEELGRFEDWDWLLRYAHRRRIGIVNVVLSRVHNRLVRQGLGVYEAAQRFIAKRRKLYPEVSPRLRRASEARIWGQVASTLGGRGFHGRLSRWRSRALLASPGVLAVSISEKLGSARRAARQARATTEHSRGGCVGLVIDVTAPAPPPQGVRRLADALIQWGWRVEVIELGERGLARRVRLARRLRRLVLEMELDLVVSCADRLSALALLSLVGSGVPVVVHAPAWCLATQPQRSTRWERWPYPLAAAIGINDSTDMAGQPQEIRALAVVVPDLDAGDELPCAKRLVPWRSLLRQVVLT
jgi:glycosyltransferase involved in cell wall biosynthesis